ncbi:MAG: pilus assembly protein PilB, partial [Verrucomicrobiales bacterium]|nr:pilus assembly protein PilB [Verrucomicrobiales bacterium]
MSDVSNPLLALVKERGLIDDLQQEEVMQEQTRTGKPMIQVLQDLGFVDLYTLLQIEADHLGTDVVDVIDEELTPEVIGTIPASTVRTYQCLPLAVYGSSIRIAFVDPLNPEMIDQVAFSVGKELQLAVADPSRIQKAIDKFYPDETAGSFNEVLKELGLDAELSKEVAKAVGYQVSDLAEMANDAPIIKFVNLVLYQAVQDR